MTASLTRRGWLGTAAAWGLARAMPAPLAGGQAAPAAGDEPFDLLVTGATVVDGTGGKRFVADVGVRGAAIAAVGELKDHPTRRAIDARGLVLAPGFIDIHTHSDRTLLADPLAHSAVRQGATTHVVGNCGSSPVPLARPAEVAGRRLRSFADFLDALRDAGTSVNVCALVGHNTVREAVMGVQNRAPSEVELRSMKDLVAQAMRAGAVGLSTGLVSPPGSWSTTEEIIELAAVAGSHGGLYASHMRGEAGTLVDSVREALRIGREARLPVQISHHKAAGQENWGKTRTTLPMIDQASRAGQQVFVDVYPYRAGSAGLSQLVPPWVHEGGTGSLLERLRDPALRERITRDMEQGTEGWPNFFKINWDDIQITTAASQQNQKWVGKRVADVARARGCSGTQACIELLIEERGAIGMINFIMDEEEVRGVLAHRLAMIGSDGFALAAESAQGMPHPRCYGCFPRVLGRYCRELELFSLETAIHKMTQMPAAQLGLADRGVIRAGAAADLVLFDYQTIIDTATFENPHQYPRGIALVVVNGQVVVEGARHTMAQPGRVLSPARA